MEEAYGERDNRHQHSNSEREMKESTVKLVSDISVLLMILYVGFILFVIGYGVDTANAFRIGRIDTKDSWDYLSHLAKQNELDERFVMATIINIRINMAAWYAIWLTSVYGWIVLPWQKRGPVHLLAVLANMATLVVHFYHLSGKDPLVPPDDPYHQKPLLGDSLVALTNLVAFLLLSSHVQTNRLESSKKD